MKVTLATVGRFHIFPLARELEKMDHLEVVYSGFPFSQLKREGVSRERVRTFPWVRPLVMGARFLPFHLPERVTSGLHELSVATLDRYIARTLPDSDVYVGHEAVGLLSGAAAKRRGMLYICDRGCPHIAWRERILLEEYERLGLKRRRRPNTYAREIAEYELADLIVVPSQFVAESFVAEGVRADRLAVVPYGVNLQRFQPVATPDPDRFDVVFVGQISPRKGIRDLLDGFRAAAIPNKKLTLIGTLSRELRNYVADKVSMDDIVLLGHVPQPKLKNILSRSHAFCLPSIEDGFGMAIAEAMACGCPPIVTHNAGGSSLVRDGENGFVVPIRSPGAIAEKLEMLAADSRMREAMSAAAVVAVQALGGWESYGREMVSVYRRTLERGSGPTLSRSSGDVHLASQL